jgi:hypothetical protein
MSTRSYLACERARTLGQEPPMATVGLGQGNLGDSGGPHLTQTQQSPQEASFNLSGCYCRTDKAVHGHDPFLGLKATEGLNVPPKIELLAGQNGDAVAVQHHPSHELSVPGGEAAVFVVCKSVSVHDLLRCPQEGWCRPVTGPR